MKAPEMHVHPETLPLLVTALLSLSGALFVHLCLSVFWNPGKVIQLVFGLTSLSLLVWPLYLNRFSVFESIYLRIHGKGPGISQIVRQIHDTLSDGALLMTALDHPENEDLRECLKSSDPQCPLIPASFTLDSSRKPAIVGGSVLSGTRRIPQRYTVTGVPCWDSDRVRCSTSAFPVAIFSAFSSYDGALLAGFCAYTVKEASVPKTRKTTNSAGCLAFNQRIEPERQISVKGIPGVYGFTIKSGRLVRAGMHP